MGDQKRKRNFAILLFVFYIVSTFATPVIGLLVCVPLALLWLNTRAVMSPKYGLELSLDLVPHAEKNQTVTLTINARYTCRPAVLNLRTEVSLRNTLTDENMRIPVNFRVKGPGTTKYRLKLSEENCGKVQVGIDGCTLKGLLFRSERDVSAAASAEMTVAPDPVLREMPRSVEGMAGKKVLVVLDNVSADHLSFVPRGKARLTEQFLAVAGALEAGGADVYLAWFDRREGSFCVQSGRTEEDRRNVRDQIFDTGYPEADPGCIYSLTARVSSMNFDYFYVANPVGVWQHMEELRRLGPVERMN